MGSLVVVGEPSLLDQPEVEVERNPPAIRPAFRTYVAGNVGVRVGGPTGPLGLPEFTTPVAM